MARKKQTEIVNEGKQYLNNALEESRQAFNTDHGTGWTFGDNWNNEMLPQFKTYINQYLFPKLTESILINTSLGNKFNWLVQETDLIGQVTEEFVFKDSIPVNMNLSKNASLMLERNYPKLITKLYGPGELKKEKFTLNNNDVRLNFAKISDAVSYALGAYTAKISAINLEEERTTKAMMIDYATNIIPFESVTHVNDDTELITEIYDHLLYLQNNTDEFNEANLASGGETGRYTTVSSLENLIILTTDKIKNKLLDTKVANTYNAGGLDITDHIISFKDLGGAYRLTADVTINAEILAKLQTFEDYQSSIGDILPAGTVFTYDIPEITDKIEIKPPNDKLFAFIMDVNAIRYKRCTNGMLKPPFYNAEFDEVTYWLHYYTFKSMSPFYNKCVIGSMADGFYTPNPVYLDDAVITSGKKTEEELLAYFNIQVGNLKALQILDFKPELLKIKNYYAIDWNSDGITELVITYNGLELTQYLGENNELDPIQVQVVKNVKFAANDNIFDFDASLNTPIPKQTLLDHFDCVLVRDVLGQPIPVATDKTLFDITNYDALDWSSIELQVVEFSYNGKPIEPYGIPPEIHGNAGA